MDSPASSPMRYLAPLALAIAAIAFLAVLAGGIGGGDDPSGDGSTEQSQRSPGEGGGGGGGGNRSGPATYEVQEGDTLDAIAAETGVSVERIQELNPDLDPQALVAGQELKLRE